MCFTGPSPVCGQTTDFLAHINIHVLRSLYSTLTDHYKRVMAHSDDYSNIQRLPQSSAHFLFSPNETLRFTPLLCVFPQTVLISKQRWTAAFRLYRSLPTQRRPFCFPHVFLYIRVTSVSRAFYFGLELIFLFVFRSVVKLAALLLLCLISVCIYHFKCCRYLDLMIVFSSLLVLHKTSGTLIF